MQIERSTVPGTNEQRAIPESCPENLRTKIQAARERRAARAVVAPESAEWLELKKLYLD
jgi:hypothetical protein